MGRKSMVRCTPKRKGEFDMGVEPKNRGILPPKWMVYYNGKAYIKHGMIWGFYHYLWKHPNEGEENLQKSLQISMVNKSPLNSPPFGEYDCHFFQPPFGAC